MERAAHRARRPGSSILIAVRWEAGWLVLGRIGQAPVRVHWTTPLGALLVSGLRLAPGAWIAFPLVVLVHELGHAVLARLRRLRVEAVEVQAYGGVCVHESRSDLDDAIVAWGGVLAQGLLAGVAALVRSHAEPSAAMSRDLLDALVEGNLWLAAFNLLPIPPLDGARAWKLPWYLWGRRGRSRPRSVRAPRRPTVRVTEADIEDVVRAALERARAEARQRRRDPSGSERG
ncbi:MAG: M50 family metallopeptidase [Myxococcales bacterium]|nr:M50 family metallopeptidase [Myxococcales bacterium]